ncbi:MAG: LysM peptidoglycan-binding domain-containing protein [Fusobacterium mortiferum]|jgi:LysM repeat protein|nr:LysM peptidoglycan-binding domain-containing protein [Fusobacterium mortiferum]
MKKLILVFYVIISFRAFSIENLRFEVEKIDENLVLVNIVGVEKKEIKSDFEEYPYHKVRKGEYLNKIAKDYQKKPAKLIQINELKNPNLIYPKQKIYLEKKKSVDIEKLPKYHIVRRGENIISIALDYEIDWKQLVKLNNLEGVTDIYPGQRILLK